MTLAPAVVLPYRDAHMTSPLLHDPLADYVRWVRHDALPRWAEDGFDAGAGRFRERLDRAARPLDVPIRAMAQGRQIYVYAHAAELGWFPDGAGLAERATAALLRDFYVEADGMGSFAFSIDGGGAVVSDVRDTYTHAFMLFALAWAYRLGGDPRLLEVVDRTVAFLDRELACRRHGGLFDAHPVTDRGKRQNPLMHLLEAYLFLERSAPGREYRARADALVELFKARLFADPPGALLEHYREDWGDHPDPAKASLWEPGHHFEWVWLLDTYGRTTGTDLTRWSGALWRLARAHGAAPDGLLYEEVGRDLAVRKSTHRAWPHTEAIKAAAARHAAGDPDARRFGEAMACALLDHFCGEPFAGGWTDRIDEEGRPLVDYVPSSTLYHLFFAAAEAHAGLPPAQA